VGHSARTVAALGVLAALVVLPGEPRSAADHAPRPAPECTLIYGDASDPVARVAVIDPATGRVIEQASADEITAVIMSICPD